VAAKTKFGKAVSPQIAILSVPDPSTLPPCSIGKMNFPPSTGVSTTASPVAGIANISATPATGGQQGQQQVAGVN
ncbi:unnamed protein product, partial [Amoebophrya sp. A25]